MWKNILKVGRPEPSIAAARKKIHQNMTKLSELKNLFTSNEQKAIGYMPIAWSAGIQKEIKALATELGLEYREYPEKFKSSREDKNSTGNGGHFMWDASKIEPVLEQTEFNSVQELVDFVANNKYNLKSYRYVIDGLFGTPDIKLQSDIKRDAWNARRRGFE